ncbi:MAG TPA: MarR family transcriptional regulator [Jatrophihabitantaceae bacterium]|jgi:DNA-binding MarR family transcriptional regulator|nr:MarR family transcriptional regulator [Jatrophihabitantaceae bacterium]
MSDKRMQPVAESIEALVMWVRRQAPSKVSTSTVTTLDSLATAGPLRISELAEREAISQPGMTTLVNRLERGGYAERVADPSDGRAILVRITDGGRALLAERRADRTAALLSEFERLDDDHRAALIAALPAVQALITGKKPSNRKKS